MPIYEFYCPACNRIYNFFSRTAANRRTPVCPRCGCGDMRRMVSRFATARPRSAKTPAEAGKFPVDEARLERAVESLAGDSELLSDDNPRSAVKLMRKLSDMTGVKFGEGMREALERLESGEDPEAIEEGLGDRLNEEEPFLPESAEDRPAPRRPAELERDETLYEL